MEAYLRDGSAVVFEMGRQRALEFESLLAKLTEVEEALDELDRQPDPLAQHDRRMRLVQLHGQLTAAVALYETPLPLN